MEKNILSPVKILKLKGNNSRHEMEQDSEWCVSSATSKKMQTKHALRQQARRRKKNTTIAAGGTSPVGNAIPPTTTSSTSTVTALPTPTPVQEVIVERGPPPTMMEVLSSIPGFSFKHRKRSNKKLSTAAQLEQTKEGCIDLETPDSILVHTNLRCLLNRHTFSSLPALYQYKLIQLLPQCDRIPQSDSTYRLSASGLNNEFFARACLEWQERLAEGEFTPENQQKLRQDAEKEKSRLDPWKLKHFEPIWGEPSSSSEPRAVSAVSASTHPSKSSPSPSPLPPPPPPPLRTVGAVTRAITREKREPAEKTPGVSKRNRQDPLSVSKSESKLRPSKPSSSKCQENSHLSAKHESGASKSKQKKQSALRDLRNKHLRSSPSSSAKRETRTSDRSSCKDKTPSERTSFRPKRRVVMLQEANKRRRMYEEDESSESCDKVVDMVDEDEMPVEDEPQMMVDTFVKCGEETDPLSQAADPLSQNDLDVDPLSETDVDPLSNPPEDDEYTSQSAADEVDGILCSEQKCFINEMEDSTQSTESNFAPHRVASPVSSPQKCDHPSNNNNVASPCKVRETDTSSKQDNKTEALAEKNPSSTSTDATTRDLSSAEKCPVEMKESEKTRKASPKKSPVESRETEEPSLENSCVESQETSPSPEKPSVKSQESTLSSPEAPCKETTVPSPEKPSTESLETKIKSPEKSCLNSQKTTKQSSEKPHEDSQETNEPSPDRSSVESQETIKSSPVKSCEKIQESKKPPENKSTLKQELEVQDKAVKNESHSENPKSPILKTNESNIPCDPSLHNSSSSEEYILSTDHPTPSELEENFPAISETPNTLIEDSSIPDVELPSQNKERELADLSGDTEELIIPDVIETGEPSPNLDDVEDTELCSTESNRVDEYFLSKESCNQVDEKESEPLIKDQSTLIEGSETKSSNEENTISEIFLDHPTTSSQTETSESSSSPSIELQIESIAEKSSDKEETCTPFRTSVYSEMSESVKEEDDSSQEKETTSSPRSVDHPVEVKDEIISAEPMETEATSPARENEEDLCDNRASDFPSGSTAPVYPYSLEQSGDVKSEPGMADESSFSSREPPPAASKHHEACILPDDSDTQFKNIHYPPMPKPPPPQFVQPSQQPLDTFPTPVPTSQMPNHFQFQPRVHQFEPAPLGFPSQTHPQQQPPFLQAPPPEEMKLALGAWGPMPMMIQKDGGNVPVMPLQEPGPGAGNPVKLEVEVSVSQDGQAEGSAVPTSVLSQPVSIGGDTSGVSSATYMSTKPVSTSATSAKPLTKPGAAGARSSRNPCNKPPPGAVNLERSYQICQAVIQNSPNRDQLKCQLKPPSALMAANKEPAPPSWTKATATAKVKSKARQQSTSPPVMVKHVLSAQGIPVTMAMLPSPHVEATENTSASGNLGGYVLVQKGLRRSSSAPPPNKVPPPPRGGGRPASVGLAHKHPLRANSDCACNLNALVSCVKCGAFCHDDCVSAAQLCGLCVMR